MTLDEKGTLPITSHEYEIQVIRNISLIESWNFSEELI